MRCDLMHMIVHGKTWVETKTCTGRTTGGIQTSSGKGNRLIILLQVDGEQ